MTVLLALKPTVWERDGDLVHVMTDPREMRTLADPEGHVEALLAVMSTGPQTVEALHASLSQRFPDTTLDDVGEGVAGLDSLGMLEDVAGADSLTEWQRDRYYTNLVFFQSFSTLGLTREVMQHRLFDANVLVLGTGGVGSTVLMHLTGAGVGRFTLVDHDVVEARNFSRQFVFRHADLGRSKVERAREWVDEYSPGTRVRAVNQKITSTDDVAQLLDGDRIDLVVAAVDWPPAEVGSWVNRACVAAGVPYVRGGMGIQSHYVSVDPGRSACFDCNRMVMLEEQEASGAAGAKWRLFQQLDLVNAGVGPIAGQVGALMAMEALRYLTGFAEPAAAGVIHNYDLSDGGAESTSVWERRADCPVCSTVGTAARAPRESTATR